MPARVVIVGGGFAGLAAAVRLLDHGIQPMILDAKAHPTTNTTGGIASWWMASLGLGYPPEAVAAKVRGVRLVGPSGRDVVWQGKETIATVIYPDKYLEAYVRDATSKGAEYVARAAFYGVMGDGGGKVSVSYLHDGQVREVNDVDAVIAADGARSGVRRFLGYPEPDPDDLHVGYEETIANPGFPDHLVHLYFDARISPKGYWWIFPDDNNGEKIRVGLGIPRSVHRNPKDNFELILKDHPMMSRPAFKVVGGNIPTAPLPPSNVHNHRVMFVGDAGRFCSPLHGGGIGFGVMSGVMAADAVIAGDVDSYDGLWQAQLKPILKRHYALKKMLYSWKDKDFDDAIDVASSFEMELVPDADPNPIIMSFIKHLILHKPSLVPKFVRLAL